MKSLFKKVAVVTGSGSGIGRALAIELADHDCLLALSDINVAGLEETKQQILAQKPNALVHIQILDVSNRQAMVDYAANIYSEFGAINIVINNAGVALSSAVGETKREDFEWLMNINFWGVINGCEAFLPYLKQASDAHIVNISSVFGMISIPKQSSYNAAKFAVRGYTEALKQEMGMNHKHIAVSCVHPGGISTDIARNARVGDDEDVIELAASFDKLAQTTPRKAANIIVAGMKKNKSRIMVGWDAHAIHVLYRLLGIHYIRLTQWLAKRLNYE
jgi:NADP-dependent 3-hydroxy acid dehydrogenase YdfG